MMARIPMPEVASTMKPVLQSLRCCVLLLLVDAVWGRDVVVDPHTVDYRMVVEGAP
jgi:hypothetical protein